MKLFTVRFSIVAFAAVAVSCSNNSSEPTPETPVVEETIVMEDENLAVPHDAKIYFVNLQNGAVVNSPVHVEMGIDHMIAEAAGEVRPGAGHHHIIINNGHISKGEIVPKDELHIHYGEGQTFDDLDLAPGNYTLTLQFANGFHQSYGEELSTSIEIIVE